MQLICKRPHKYFYISFVYAKIGLNLLKNIQELADSGESCINIKKLKAHLLEKELVFSAPVLWRLAYCGYINADGRFFNGKEPHPTYYIKLSIPRNKMFSVASYEQQLRDHIESKKKYLAKKKVNDAWIVHAP